MSLPARIRVVLAYGFYVCARLDLSSLAAVLALLAIRRLKRTAGRATHTILILPKDGFTQDILSALDTAHSTEVQALPRVVVRKLSRAFLPYFIDDNNYVSAGVEFDEAKERYRRFLKKMITTLLQFRRIDAVVTGNFGYCGERELAAALSELAVPFIALHKENLKTAGRVAFFERIYRERRGPFGGRKILVYNGVERDLQIRAGVVPAERIDIVGMARLDRMHTWRRINAGRVFSGRILFFLFSPVTGMPRIVRKGARRGEVHFEYNQNDLVGDGEMSLAGLCRQTCLTLRRLAQENPDIEIIVKSKGRQYDNDDIGQLFDLHTEHTLPGNLRIVHGGDVLSLIAEASVVCGFNSTALLEALAAGKPVVLPWFEEAESPGMAPYIIDLRDVCATAFSPEDLFCTLVEFARNPRPVPVDLNAETRECLVHWTGNADGRASIRTQEAIIATVAERESMAMKCGTDR